MDAHAAQPNVAADPSLAADRMGDDAGRTKATRKDDRTRNSGSRPAATMCWAYACAIACGNPPNGTPIPPATRLRDTAGKPSPVAMLAPLGRPLLRRPNTAKTPHPARPTASLPGSSGRQRQRPRDRRGDKCGRHAGAPVRPGAWGRVRVSIRTPERCAPAEGTSGPSGSWTDVGLIVEASGRCRPGSG